MLRRVPTWDANRLAQEAKGVSASRRTDIPALFGPWLLRRIEEGWAEYQPPRSPRRRASLSPEQVTHWNFWTKWPRPFFRVLETLLDAGYPVLWNVTITGLGGSDVEPHVPRTDRAVAALKELSRMVPPAAIQWRYDPVFLSDRYDAAWHARTFRSLCEQLAGHVDRVASSFVCFYGRRVAPDLRAYEEETGDGAQKPEKETMVDLAGQLRDIALSAGIPFTICCMPELKETLGCPASGCNSFDWARRVYPALNRHRLLAPRPTRPGCACSEEVDIGAYDSCTLGCRYSYGSCDEATARARFARHDPDGPAIVPSAPGHETVAASTAMRYKSATTP